MIVFIAPYSSSTSLNQTPAPVSTNPFDHGKVLLFNKPKDWTSFDAVKKVRNLCRTKKVGHAGTLDPLATGLLIICTGPKTKQIQFIQADEKEYTGSFFLGATTASYDLETEVENIVDINHLTNELIHAATKNFIGTILQTPPLYSAVKINGQRAYTIARKGGHQVLEPKEITIREFEITNIELPIVEFRVTCSKGTYIRSLANDFGKVLNTGAYLQSLCRTRIGEYLLKDALEIKDFAESELVLSLKSQKTKEA